MRAVRGANDAEEASWCAPWSRWSDSDLVPRWGGGGAPPPIQKQLMITYHLDGPGARVIGMVGIEDGITYAELREFPKIDRLLAMATGTAKPVTFDGKNWKSLIPLSYVRERYPQLRTEIDTLHNMILRFKADEDE